MQGSTGIVPPEPPAEPDPFRGPDSWNGDPPQQDTLGGVVTEVGEVTTDKHGGATVPLLQIRNGDGEDHDVPCWRAHLRQLVEEHNLVAGDRVAIRRFGPAPGQLTVLYGITVQKAGADDDIPF
jgi:hypothetical protein